MANPNPPPDNNGKKYKRKMFDPRTTVFKMFFLDPGSETFWNIRGSAIRAGYSEEYASNISNNNPQWWSELITSSEFNRAEMLAIAEKNIKNTMEDKADTDTRVKLKHDASKFIAERVGKQFYSTRQEVTGADGRSVFASEDRESAKQPLASLFKGIALS